MHDAEVPLSQLIGVYDLKDFIWNGRKYTARDFFWPIIVTSKHCINTSRLISLLALGIQ